MFSGGIKKESVKFEIRLVLKIFWGKRITLSLKI